MTAPATSIIIVSRGRPDALALCLTATAQLRYPNFEVIVVADPPGLAALALWADRITIIPFDTPNISAARNLGLAAAAGDIVAFIDDDAVPEPTWLTHLTAPFTDPTVMAATGFVLARNGISFQWKACDARPDGSCHPLMVSSETPTILDPTPHAIKTEGTNMAFRRTTLAARGGFDPAFRFYLDETDLNLRLMARTAIVPLAQVHHGFAPSDRRRPDRTPRDLHDIGASLAVFLRKHHPGDPRQICIDERAAQRRRLLAHMVAGRLEPRDVNRILSTFDAGWQDGTARPLAPLPPIPPSTRPFLPFKTPTGPHELLSARRLPAIAPRAAALAAQGHVVTAVVLSPTVRPHRVRFHPAGFWLHTGGLFGKSLRTDPAFRVWRFSDRVLRELRRIAPIRTGSHTDQKSS